jgi:hypothetical protein
MKYCHVPFTTIYLYKDTAMTCCGSWMVEGRIPYCLDYMTPAQVWDHPTFVKTREHWSRGDTTLCQMCPLLATNDRHVFVEGDIPPLTGGSPTRVYISNEAHCNIHCYTCRPWIMPLDPDKERRESDMWTMLWGWRHNIEWLSALGSGELFASPIHLRLMENLRVEDFPKMHLEVFTNGLLLPKNWHRLEHLKGRVKQVTISIDACTRETYESVRAPAKWEQLMEALSFVKNLRDTGEIRYFQCNFVTRKVNYREAPGFVDLCKAHGATQVRFSIFDKTYHSDEEYAKEAATKEDFQEIITDPRLSSPGVNADILRAAASGAEFRA